MKTVTLTIEMPSDWSDLDRKMFREWLNEHMLNGINPLAWKKPGSWYGAKIDALAVQDEKLRGR